ncbi:MAG: putative oxygen-independent coproporphyrinogen III oxidase [Gammaproteobacteria bacterium]|jgi:putative oxygen-independent coproporphyrinogen III oxidase
MRAHQHSPRLRDTRPVFHALPPLSLYVHLPWCVRKCPYCDFNSHALKAELEQTRYVDALLADLEHELPRIWGRTIETIFIGGGTPSLFDSESIERLLAGIHARTRVAPGAEITLEANPGAADAERFTGYVAAGVNRLSLGVQSFDDSLLARIGRIHDGDAAREAVCNALASGASKVNADLMFALPGQSVEQSALDVSEALALGVRHVSFYQLTLEPNTAFHRNPPMLPREDDCVDMQQQGIDQLARSGIVRYEVSAFAAAAEQSRHNLNYWRFGDYLGIGAGAHGKLTMANEQVVMRSVKQRQPTQFMRFAGTAEGDLSRREVPSVDLPFEFMLNALRLVDGFPPALFSQSTGLELDVVKPIVERCQRDGLLEVSDELIRPSALGQRFLDDLTERFVPD